MCKSANQPGGPYRCSGDMKAALEKAQDAYGEALDGTADPYVKKVQAEHQLSRTQAMIESVDTDRGDLDDQGKTELRETLVPALEQRRQAVKEASNEHAAAQSRSRDAGQRLRQAQADYDATPRGVAEVQAGIDEQFDPQRPEVPKDAAVHGELVARRDAAIDRMNSESAERRKQWGTITGERVPIARMDDTPNAAQRNAYGAMAQEDGLTASSVNHGYTMDPETGQEYNDTVVTFYRQSDTGVAEMRVSYRSPTTSEPPSQAKVLAEASKMSMQYETSQKPSSDGTGKHDFRRYCAQQGVPEDERDLARVEYDAGGRYSRQMRAFLGDGAGKYMAQAAQDSGRFLPLDRTHGSDGRPLFEAVGG